MLLLLLLLLFVIITDIIYYVICEAHLEAGNLRCNVIILVQLGGLLQLRLHLKQRLLDLYVRRPGLVKVLTQRGAAQQAQHIRVKSRHLLSQPA